MNTIDKKYQELLQDILDNGVTKMDRTGTGTLSVFGRQIRHNMSEGFPLLTTKKMAWKTMVTELLWFLRGDTNIKYLVDNNCHIWDGDAYKNFCNSHTEIFVTQEEFIERIKDDGEFANKWGELGPVYGAQWRKWYWRSEPVLPEEKYMIYTTEGKPVTWSEDKQIDQIQNLINDLKTNPDSRRLMVNAWAVHDLPNMVLPPCHYGFQVYTRELSFEERHTIWDDENRKANVSPYTESQLSKMLDKENIPKRAISLMYNCRSQDVPLGTPFNISSYALLLEIIGKMVNMVPDELITNMGDCHIYLNQVDGIKEQLTREPFPLPTLKHMKTDEFYKSLSEDLSLFTHLDNTDFVLENYQSHPTIKMPLSN